MRKLYSFIPHLIVFLLAYAVSVGAQQFQAVPAEASKNAEELPQMMIDPAPAPEAMEHNLNLTSGLRAPESVSRIIAQVPTDRVIDGTAHGDRTGQCYVVVKRVHNSVTLSERVDWSDGSHERSGLALVIPLQNWNNLKDAIDREMEIDNNRVRQ